MKMGMSGGACGELAGGEAVGGAGKNAGRVRQELLRVGLSAVHGGTTGGDRWGW